MGASMVISALDALAQILSKRAREIEAGTHSADLADNADMRREVVQVVDGLDSSALNPHNPAEMTMWFMNQLSYFTAIRLFIEWGAFEKMPTEKGATISYTELAAKLEVGADAVLVARIGQALVAHGALAGVAGGTVAHTDFSKTLATPSGRAALRLGFDLHARAWMCSPKYFGQLGLAEPTDPRQSLLAFAAGRLGSTTYEVIYEEFGKDFTDCFAVMDRLFPSLGSYDLTWVIKEADQAPDRVLLVDVGGGDGRALIRMLQRVPALPRRRCVLQDLPPMIEAAREGRNPDLAGVQMVAIDFFKEQPIKGALVYYIRHCLHNHPDDQCVTILQQTAKAMAPDSRLLIVEVLVDDPPTTRQATFDMMMLIAAGKERTLASFEHITGRAGLRITQVSQFEKLTAVIECMLA